VARLISLVDHVRDVTIQRDLDAVGGAIILVALGQARRVILANLRSSEAILPSAVALGQSAGVVVRGNRTTGRLAIDVGPRRARDEPS
jgi:hypothetical protein